jgi:hypothetical protein
MIMGKKIKSHEFDTRRPKHIAKETEKVDDTFFLALHHNLENGYDFNALSKQGCRLLHLFVQKTVGVGASWQEVNDRFLRTKGAVFRDEFHQGHPRRVSHYAMGNGRIFGYRVDNHFVICRIDPNHRFDG